ncbi:hypothetical protein DFR33_103414 [Bradymonas sediminis]|nr:hypothetical protein DFR33_103414 [Bradymonas sediminis]
MRRAVIDAQPTTKLRFDDIFSTAQAHTRPLNCDRKRSRSKCHANLFYCTMRSRFSARSP